MENMTRSEIIEKGKTYDNVQNEGGEGYNPYWSELERRDIESSKIDAVKPRSKKDQISALHDKIRIECGSVAREWGNEEADKKQAGYYAEIKALETAIETEFSAEWTLETTKTRRVSWNDFIRSLMNSKGQIGPQSQPKIYQRKIEQGWGLDDLKKAIKLHNLGSAK